MLVLTRYLNQSIYIGDDIVITIVGRKGDDVRLGIKAPPEVPVHRKEVHDAIVRDRAESGEAARRLAAPQPPGDGP